MQCLSVGYFKYARARGITVIPQRGTKIDHLQDTRNKCLVFVYIFAVKRYFVFKNLCFGLSSACQLFTKLTRPLVTAWGGSGINCYMYLDDGAAVFRTYLDAQRGSQLLQNYLQQSGFQVNSKKSRWQPSQQLEWLGFNFDSTNMKISVNEAKIQKDIQTCTFLLSKQTESARQMAGLVGQLISMQRALGPNARMRTRQLSYWINDMLKANLSNDASIETIQGYPQVGNEAGCPLQTTSKNSIQSCSGSTTAGSSKYATSTNANEITCHPPCEGSTQHPIWVACTNECGSNADSNLVANRPPCQLQTQRPNLAAYTNTHGIGEETASSNTRHPHVMGICNALFG